MHNKSINNQNNSLTVVIATLGEKCLTDTIENLNKGTVVPDEILICIPELESQKAKDINISNVKTIITDCKGQVPQRAIGFKNATHQIVMQIDDDMLVDRCCIEHLLNTLAMHGKSVSVGPALMNLSTGKSAYNNQKRNKVLQNIYYWVMNGTAGFQPGKIDKSGTPVGVDTTDENQGVVEVEWLAGGCLMHYKGNLILDDYYPYKGRAFSEDIIHSFYLREKGVKLLLESKALCWVNLIPVSNCSIREFILKQKLSYRARKYYFKISSRNSFRIYFFYLASILRYVLAKRQIDD
jgi:glycosyltransferase involved in cell wall biosynthesis